MSRQCMPMGGVGRFIVFRDSTIAESRRNAPGGRKGCTARQQTVVLLWPGLQCPMRGSYNAVGLSSLCQAPSESLIWGAPLSAESSLPLVKLCEACRFSAHQSTVSHSESIELCSICALKLGFCTAHAIRPGHGDTRLRLFVFG